VKAHQHFLDPEWDGEPIEPEPKEPCPTCGQAPCVCRKKVKVKLADGKERTIQHMMCTSFWHPDGTPMSALQFMELLFGRLPEFFGNEDELRSIWSVPETRRKLLQGLADRGFGHDQLSEMQRIIDAEASDLFDVLAHVAYSKTPITREWPWVRTRGRNWSSDSARRRSPPRVCTIRTSSPSTRSAFTKASTFSSWTTSRGRTWRGLWQPTAAGAARGGLSPDRRRGGALRP